MDIESVFFQTTDFEIHKDKKIGQGSFGEVFIATKIDSAKQYAAKIINKSSNDFDGQDQMIFLRESLILHKLNHPLILKLEGINFKATSESDKIEPTIITDYLPNGSLRSNLKNKLDITQKYMVLLGIADAMRYLHENNIIHRDLKTENILMDEKFYPIVSDFGLSRCFPDAIKNRFEKIQMSRELGTPLYMAPELFEKGVYDNSIDVYSFALIMYEIVTGNEPYYELKSISFFKLFQKVTGGYRPCFGEKYKNEKMKNLISTCWSANADERPTFKEIFNLLSNDFSYVDEKMDTKKIKKFINKLNDDRKKRKKEEKRRKKKVDDDDDEYVEKKGIDKIATVNDTDDVTYKIYDKIRKAEIIEMKNVKSKIYKIPSCTGFGSDKYKIQKICNNALEYSNIQKLIINKNINELENLWCKGAKQLMEIDVDPRNAYFRNNEDGTLTFENDLTSKREILFYSKNFEGKFKIPNDIEKIGDFSFTNHKKITMLESKSSSIKTIGSYAFYNCENLQTVSIRQATSSLTLDCFCFSNLLNLKSFEVLCKEFESKENCFCSSNLTKFTILKSKTVKFHPNSFNDCSNLMEFSVYKSNEVIIEKDLFQSSDQLKYVLLDYVKKVTFDKETFKEFENLETVSVTNSETINIGEECFSCSNLQTIELSANSINIGQNFIRNCNLLTTVDIKSKGDITISTNAFKLSHLKEITLHAAKLKLCSYCFEGLENLETIKINCSEIEICSECFNNCQILTSISLICSNSLSLTKNTFIGCNSFKEITLKSNNELQIKDEFLNGLSSLEKLTLCGKKKITIGNSCFKDCNSLEFFTILKSGIICIGDNEFVNCTSLEKIAIKSTAKSEIKFGQNCFSGAINLTEFQLEEGDFTLKNECFKNCSSLTRLFLLKLSKITIGDNQLSELQSLQNVIIKSEEEIKLGLECFKDSKQLETVNLDSKSVTLSKNCFINCTSLNNNDFKIKAVDLFIEEDIFKNCNNMTNIVLSASSNLTLFEKSFAESKIESIELNAQNVIIEKECFSKCSSLTKFTCGKISNLTLESYVFNKCVKLEQINIDIVKLLTIKDECFIGSNINRANFRCETINIGNNCFQNHSLINQIIISSVDITIGKSSFEKCPNIQSIKIEASSNLVINESCFSSDKNMNSLDLRGSVIDIGKSCFSNCNSLKSLSFESSNQIILGENAFEKCYNISNVTISSKTVLIDKSCFSNCSLLEYIHILKAEYAKFDEKSFEECKKLTTVVISAIKQFKAKKLCFQKNTSLKNVNINSEEISLNSYCFEKCTALSKISCNLAKTIEYHINALNGRNEREFIECSPEANIIMNDAKSDDEDDHCLIC